MSDAERIKQLEDEIAAYKINGAVGLYYELNRIVNESVKFSRGRTIQSLISGDEKGDKTFERYLALMKSAKEHIIDMEEIKTKLNLTGEEEKDKSKRPFVDKLADTRR